MSSVAVMFEVDFLFLLLQKRSVNWKWRRKNQLRYIPTSFTGFTITFTYFYLMPTGSWI